jgi:hypothetical protein
VRFLKILVLCLCFAVPCFSDTVDQFNFNQNLGDIGKTDLLKLGLVQFLISGFNSPGTAGDLWEKNLGPTEFGIGLQEQRDHEIGISGKDFLQIDISKLSALSSVESVTMGLNSIQSGESYDVWGSNTAGMLGTLIAANQTLPEFGVPLAPFQFISITAGSGDVLLDNVDVTVRNVGTPTPEPSSIFLFATGLVILGAVISLKKFRPCELR